MLGYGHFCSGNRSCKLKFFFLLPLGLVVSSCGDQKDYLACKSHGSSVSKSVSRFSSNVLRTCGGSRGAGGGSVEPSARDQVWCFAPLICVERCSCPAAPPFGFDSACRSEARKAISMSLAGTAKKFSGNRF